jgi:hypothetical protein
VSQGGATIAGNAASDGAFRITNTGKTRIQNNDVDDALNVTGGAAFGLASGTQTIAIGETTDRFVINEASNIAMGSDQGTQQLHLDIYDGGTNKCSYITLYDDGGNARFMWFDNTGDMRTNNGPPTNNDCNTLGTVVGTQS